MRTLEDLGPSKLQPDEQALVRDAADTLIFCDGPATDAGARRSLHDATELCDALVLSGRWTELTARNLLGDIAGCGPREPLALQAA